MGGQEKFTVKGGGGGKERSNTGMRDEEERNGRTGRGKWDGVQKLIGTADGRGEREIRGREILSIQLI